MENPKNARQMLEEMRSCPKPNLRSLPRVNILDQLKSLGKPNPPAAQKKIASEFVGLDESPKSFSRHTPKRIFFDLSTSKRAVAQIGRLPETDETIHCLMGGEYHGFDLIVAVQALAAAPIDELYITTLGFNRHNISHLCAMLSAGLIGSVKILCSSYFASSDNNDYLYARQSLADLGQTLIATRNHSKILLFSIGDRRYVVESSANLRSCNNLEQFSLAQSPELHAFHRTWIETALRHARG